MGVVSAVLVSLVAMEHIYILYLEMFLWTRPRGMKTFGLKPEQAEATKVFAANQGLYNGFLAVGLIWGLLHPVMEVGIQIQIFFLLCIIVAGIYGGLTAKPSIVIVQGLPALIALMSVLLFVI